MIEDLKFKLGEDGEPELSLCDYDKERCCHCMTKSVDEGTHFRCGKCGATK